MIRKFVGPRCTYPSEQLETSCFEYVSSNTSKFFSSKKTLLICVICFLESRRKDFHTVYFNNKDFLSYLLRRKQKSSYFEYGKLIFRINSYCLGILVVNHVTENCLTKFRRSFSDFNLKFAYYI